MSGTKPTRRERLEAREEVILDAARKVFRDGGYAGAKMSDIARAAAVAEGTLYLYFKNKDALLEAVIERFYDDLTDDAERGVAPIEDTFERLAFLARHHVDRCLAEWQLLELMIGLYRGGMGYDYGSHRSLNRRYVAIFDRVIREGMHRGELRDDLPPRLLRDLFYGTLEYAIRTLRMHPEETPDNDGTVAGVLSILRQGAVVPGASAQPPSEAVRLERVADRLTRVATRLETRLDDVR
ncbi:MAG: TetR/AcrR family transcriptional regulator [Pseudomonadota bacterium]